MKRILDVHLGIKDAGGDSHGGDPYIPAAPLSQVVSIVGSLGAFHNDIITSLSADLLQKNAILLLRCIIFLLPC